MLRILSLLILGSAILARDLATCTNRTRLCNGDYFCDNVCNIGAVVPDTHSDRALALQRMLQFDERVARQTFIGSHNSAISLAYGYGIEMDGFEKLLNTTLYDNDDLGEGVDQTFSVTDQLNLGLRHLEIDITAAYFELPPKLDDVYVCHSPVPLDPAILARVEAAALEQHVKLGKWEPSKLSCLGTRVPLKTMLLEVHTWLDAHPNEFVVLYLDTKPLTMTGRSQANAMSAVLRDVFGTSMFAVGSDGGPSALLNETIRSLIAKGKRLYIEDHADHYNDATDRIVYTPAVWSHQFGASSLAPFPNCTIAGDGNWYTPLVGPAKPLARGLYSSGSTLSGDLAKHDASRAAATTCGVNIVSPNYVQPRDMAAFVWTWDVSEPAKGGTCVVQRPNGRWAAVPCAQTAALPLACRKAGDDRSWRIAPPAEAAESGCGSGGEWLARPPTNGFANELLRAAAAAGGVTTAIMLNVSVDGAAGSPRLP